jgi:uncharacterized damage-inducible protein DinB
MIDPRYPIGQFERQDQYSVQARLELIERLRQTPSSLHTALLGLDDAQQNTPYRDGGWTVRQVAHHVPDSHLNAYTRVKLALTEDRPIIKPYDEEAWAQLEDTKRVPLEVSVALLEAVHTRWVAIFQSLSEVQWKLEYLHPVNGAMSLEATLASYVWHGEHHIAQITALRQRQGW